MLVPHSSTAAHKSDQSLTAVFAGIVKLSELKIAVFKDASYQQGDALRIFEWAKNLPDCQHSARIIAVKGSVMLLMAARDLQLVGKAEAVAILEVLAADFQKAWFSQECNWTLVCDIACQKLRERGEAQSALKCLSQSADNYGRVHSDDIGSVSPDIRREMGHYFGEGVSSLSNYLQLELNK